MAKVLKIYDGTTTLNLLSSTVCLAEDGWETQTSRGAVWDIFDMIANTTDANIRAYADTLDDFADDVREYHDNPLEETAVWFYWQSEGESVKRALIMSISSNLRSWLDRGPLLGDSFLRFRIAIKRTPHFENDTATNVVTATALDALGGTLAIGNAAGTLPQRIGAVEISTADAAYSHQQIWMGIRPLYKGVSGFVPVWEAEDGSLTANGGTNSADASASGGSRVTTDLSQTANEGSRGSITISQVAASSADYEDFVGKYLILGRMKLSDGTTQVAVEMRSYWQGSHMSAGLIYIDSIDDWTLFPLGELMFPPAGNRDSIATGAADLGNLGFNILATRVSGAGNLYMDCFVLIPIEHNVTIQGCSVNATGPNKLNLFTDPDDRHWAMGVSSLTQGGLQPAFTNWYYPRQGGLLVVATQADTGSQLSKTIDLDIDIYPRYASYRA